MSCVRSLDYGKLKGHLIGTNATVREHQPSLIYSVSNLNSTSQASSSRGGINPSCPWTMMIMSGHDMMVMMII